MDKLNKTIELLSNELDGYSLPAEVDKAISVAKDIDTLQRAKVILNTYYDGNQTREG